MCSFLVPASRRIAFALLFFIFAVSAQAALAEQFAAEQRTANALEAVRNDPLRLRAFLAAMPKGADLHSHLHSAVFAETLIEDGVEDGLCVDTTAHAFAKPQSVTDGAPVCAAGAVPAATVYEDQTLYNALIDAFSMRGFVPSEGETGHDHFFGAFKKFAGTDVSHIGEWLDEVAARAARQNVQYLELMATPTCFSQFLESPEQIATNVLTDRLALLEQAGLVTKAPYQLRPKRFEYSLTRKGEALLPMLQEMCRWANRHLPGTWTPPDSFMRRKVE